MAQTAALIKQQKDLLEMVGKLKKDVDPAVKAELMSRIKDLQAKLSKIIEEAKEPEPVAPVPKEALQTPVEISSSGTNIAVSGC